MTRPSLTQMLARGARRRCPWCAGRGAFFTGWSAKASSCTTCGLRWRRGDDGFELGAASMLAIMTLGPLIVMLGFMLSLTWPDVAIGATAAVLVPIAVLLPVLLYPVSYTIWQALDLAMRPVGADDFDADVIWQALSNGG